MLSELTGVQPDPRITVVEPWLSWGATLMYVVASLAEAIPTIALVRKRVSATEQHIKNQLNHILMSKKPFGSEFAAHFRAASTACDLAQEQR